MSKYADSIVRIPCSLSNFFSYWVEFMRPFHKLTDREGEVFSLFLEERYNLSKVIHDEDILDNVLMSEETKKKIRERGEVGVQHIYAIMKSFEKNKVIVNGRINRRFVPRVPSEKGNYKLMFLFEFKGDE